MKPGILAFTLGIVISVTTPTHAHHSIAGVYDGGQQVTIEGVVAEFQFVNPHPFVTIDITYDGIEQLWQLEMDNRWELARIGMSSETLKQGDRIIVTGSPAREREQSLYIRRLDRPADGFGYEQIGSSPRIRAGSP